MQKEFSAQVVQFRLIHTPCCGHLLCWVNPRRPNYCPECGKQFVRGQIDQSVMVRDDAALLKVHDELILDKMGVG